MTLELKVVPSELRVVAMFMMKHETGLRFEVLTVVKISMLVGEF
jgi:hypothetical protein